MAFKLIIREGALLYPLLIELFCIVSVENIYVMG